MRVRLPRRHPIAITLTHIQCIYFLLHLVFGGSVFLIILATSLAGADKKPMFRVKPNTVFCQILAVWGEVRLLALAQGLIFFMNVYDVLISIKARSREQHILASARGSTPLLIPKFPLIVFIISI